MAAQLPNLEFYLRCITKCRAVPEGERSADVRALLESHELIEAALADVPLDGGSAAPSRAAVAVALARYQRAYVLCDTQVPHPVSYTTWFCDEGASYLEHVDMQGEQAQSDEDKLGALLCNMLAGQRLPLHDPTKYGLLTRCLNELDTAGDRVDTALTQLAAAAGGSGPRLPTAAELRVACLAPIALECRPVPPAPMDGYERAVQRLVQLVPGNPPTTIQAAQVELMRGRKERGLPLLRRAYEAARAQHFDNHVAASGFQLVISTPIWWKLARVGVDVEGGCPRPSELLDVLPEAEAAFQRCQRLLPSVWTRGLVSLRTVAARMKAPLRLMVESQRDSLRAPPGPAGAAVEQLVSEGLIKAEAAIAPQRAAVADLHTLECSGCGSWTPALRKCSACQQVRYCR